MRCASKWPVLLSEVGHRASLDSSRCFVKWPCGRNGSPMCRKVTRFEGYSAFSKALDYLQPIQVPSKKPIGNTAARRGTTGRAIASGVRWSNASLVPTRKATIKSRDCQDFLGAFTNEWSCSTRYHYHLSLAVQAQTLHRRQVLFLSATSHLFA